jgi:predicted metal-dependent enzyme (double-stranded beta helix superfamily)
MGDALLLARKPLKISMYLIENLLNELRTAAASKDLNAVADVVRNAVRHEPLVPQVGASQLLHAEQGLTVLHTVVNPGFVSPPHDHRTWAVIGVYDGHEDNTFFRLLEGSRNIQPIGRRALTPGEVLSLASEAIHRIANPLTRKLIALHVYGKNIFEIERSAWDPATGNERPFQLAVDERGMVRR